MTILIHNTKTNRMERYERGTREPMPYANVTLQVGEFRGTSHSNLLWSTSGAMESWVATRNMWGQPIYLPYAFRRIGEGGHAAQSQHYAGTAFDCAQNIGDAKRAQLRALAQRSGLWSYIEPVSLTPTWVHFDRRLGPPACAAGYPLLRRGSVGVYVCILQDALNIACGATLVIDGIYGIATDDVLEFYQAASGLVADGIVGCKTWQALTTRVVGQGFAP
ncbi:MAG: peptidoglycan-binding protein [Oscillospiraceae bacterium]|jgi:hypothetical protein|nr:peptidoglycan-binding protein [Oscillospiraceae bacterium]